ncbi:MAG TPA: hypothetical protein VEC56_08900 [Candidatus Krumholzibacteria bacterium]|nr:hypothetical protein [Candidatus Krumholzibacteria bacterium]
MKAKAKTKAKSTLKTKTTTTSNSEFTAAHKKLEAILRKYRRGLQSRPDPTGGFCLVGPPTETSRGREVWFGAVQTRKNYVSYHLMPVYAFPDLLEGASPELKRRMQGKSCFNFKGVDAKLFAELAKLTEKGYQRFKEEKLIR